MRDGESLLERMLAAGQVVTRAAVEEALGLPPGERVRGLRAGGDSVHALLLAVASGIVGTWAVLRGLSFYAHAVGTAAFPGLVLADGLGFSPALGAFGVAVVFALGT